MIKNASRSSYNTLETTEKIKSKPQQRYRKTQQIKKKQMEILELKSVIIEIKESVDELNSRMEGEKRNNASGICGSVQKV